MKGKIDEIDLKIIRELKRDARKSYREIADKLKVAEGTVYNRVNKLQKTGVIKAFISDIDFSKLGYDLTAIIGLKVQGGKLSKIEQDISQKPDVSAVYDVTGDYDAILVAKFKNRTGMNNFVKELNAMTDVERTYTMVVLNVIKEAHGIDI
ncbi:MAG: AsnC family transcriptional regulator [Candidatus Altiarchaeales archaeon ex4484_96]|nr:MAG: AsnC family transcriptional regulator [Candidatus Altiarchaeales archaeon ex4484_96]